MAGLAAPESVRSSLEDLRKDLVRSAGENLAGLVLYGGLARRRYHERSDVNLVVVLRTARGEDLDAIAPSLYAAYRRFRAEPLVLTVEDVPRLATLFPLKFLDIQEAHIVLSGTDPFSGRPVDTRQLRWRARQELQNLELRLRRRYVLFHDDPAELSRTLIRSYVPLAIQVRALAASEGLRVPSEGNLAAVFETVARAWDLDPVVPASVAALRDRTSPPEDASRLYLRFLDLVARVVTRAEVSA